VPLWQKKNTLRLAPSRLGGKKISTLQKQYKLQVMKKIIFAVLILLSVNSLFAQQYFGRNKPRYQEQNFKVTETPHFEIYEYLNNPEKKKELAEAAEMWYKMHQQVLLDTFTRLNPMIIYNDHAGFQQTNAIQGDIGVGTGGVTEGLRNRVIFPIAPTNQQTNHVLGHELVHAFQYNMILNGDSTNMQNLANMPLWMIEGLAEYLSIGRIDPHTAMVMRDAVLYDNMPKSFRALDSGRFFPYRWGQSFWAYVTGRYGDEVIKPLFMNTAKYGLEPAIIITLNIRPDQLCDEWTAALRSTYGEYMKRIQNPDEVTGSNKKKDDDVLAFGLRNKAPGKLILSDDNSGRMNICPTLSPNGKHLIFLSEKSVFSIDLYLADAKTGKIERKVMSTVSDGHVDQMNFIESSGTWSPDSKKFAFDVYQQGQSVLVIKDIFKGKRTQKHKIPGVPAFCNPAWSPDGRTIVVTGLVNGQTDLFAYDIKSKKVRQLTNDKYSEILASWSADGSQLVYSTDQLSMERGRTNGAWKMNLAVMNIASGTTDMIDIFPGADNVNPNFDKSGNIIFLSDADGFRNLYQYETLSKKVFKMSDLLTGISGITAYAPAVSVAEDRDRIVYTYLNDDEYSIYTAQSTDFKREEVSATEVNHVPAALPPFRPGARDIVNTNLRIMDSSAKAAEETTPLTDKKYKPKFGLDLLTGGAGAGVMTGNTQFGNNVGVAGGINAIFSDVLGNNQIFTGASLNGDVQDISAVASYINQKNRIGWGITTSHIPFSTFGGQNVYLDTIEAFGRPTEALVQETFIDRLFNQRVGGIVFYPFSTTKRIELSGAMDFYQQRSTVYADYYIANQFGQPVLFASQRERGPRGLSVSMASINAAFVGDNAFFGATAPLQGWRYRLSAEQYFGFWDFSSLLADGRYYQRVGKFTFAVRGLVNARIGGNANDINNVFPLFVIQPWFVRGFLGGLTGQPLVEGDQTLFERSAGSKMAVGNFEIRVPFTGPRGLALIPTRAFLSDLNIFIDSGVAWFTNEQLRPNPVGSGVQHTPFISTGVSLRFNLFGALIVEPYFALPISIEPELRQWGWGLNIQPGW
jgi:Tol biopolymer transport system component